MHKTKRPPFFNMRNPAANFAKIPDICKKFSKKYCQQERDISCWHENRWWLPAWNSMTSLTWKLVKTKIFLYILYDLSFLFLFLQSNWQLHIQLMKTVSWHDWTDIDVGKNCQATKKTDTNAGKFVKRCAGRDINVNIINRQWKKLKINISWNSL